MSAADVLAQHQINQWAQHDGWWGCTCDGDMRCDAAHQLDALQAAGYEIFRVAAECAHCGKPIKYEPDFKLWFHPSSGIEHCYRAPEHTEVATPKHVADAVEVKP